MSLVKVTLKRKEANQPWGFRIHGGVDFGQPLIVLKVTAGSIAAQHGLVPADQIIQINSKDALHLRHSEAQQLILGAGTQVEFEVLRGDRANLEKVSTAESSSMIQTIKKTTTTETTSSTSAIASIVQSSSAVSTAPVTPGWRGPTYNEESIKESIHSQSQVLQSGAMGVNFMKKNEKNLDLEKSEVLRVLKEMEHNKSQTQSPAPPPLSPSAVGLINRAYDYANQALEAQAAWAQQLSPGARHTAPVQ